MVDYERALWILLALVITTLLYSVLKCALGHLLFKQWGRFVYEPFTVKWAVESLLGGILCAFLSIYLVNYFRG